MGAASRRNDVTGRRGAAEVSTAEAAPADPHSPMAISAKSAKLAANSHNFRDPSLWQTFYCSTAST